MVAPGQSAYNPVERSMATLSKKVTGITLPIDHLELTDELGLHNFEYGANLWRKDRILENRLQIFPNIEGESQGHNEESEPLVPWSWIETIVSFVNILWIFESATIFPVVFPNVPKKLPLY